MNPYEPPTIPAARGRISVLMLAAVVAYSLVVFTGGWFTGYMMGMADAYKGGAVVFPDGR